MEDLEYLRTFYKDFLDKCCAHGFKFFECKDRYDFYEWEHKCGIENIGIYCTCGATKMVMWEETLPYVIKIPFLENRNGYRNFCEIEVRNYKEAQENSEIVDCFAWEDFLFNYKDVPIYIMEKVDCDECGISDAAYSYSFDAFCAGEKIERGTPGYEDAVSSFADDYYDWWDGIEQMEALLRENWGNRIFEKFQDFCYRRNIGDLHFANWGYRGGMLIAVDYSGC